MLCSEEEELWLEDTRFDVSYMERIIADDFFEFGMSGRVYKRAETINVPRCAIDAVIPLPKFKARLISEDVAQITYDSEVTYNGVTEYAHRSSIWKRKSKSWILKFHQGTPYEANT